MNEPQRVWWEQASSDHRVFTLLRREGMPQCHVLHYLQMTTEKIAKAYFWNGGKPLRKSHRMFVELLRSFGRVPQPNREYVANLFSFRRYDDFQSRLRTLLPIAYELQQLAPDLANDGPNPEYPWPHARPEFIPAKFEFPIWKTLNTGQGRDLMRVIQIAVERFPEYSDL